MLTGLGFTDGGKALGIGVRTAEGLAAARAETATARFLAARAFTSADPHVANAANAIEAAMPGHVVGVNSQIAMSNGLKREIDIDLGNLVVQVKSGSARGVPGHLVRTGITTGRTAIGYAPDIPNGAWEAAARQGIPMGAIPRRTAGDYQGARMKGAFVLANDPGLYRQIEDVLVLAGGRTAADQTVQIEDRSGFLFTVFGTIGPEFDADLRASPTDVRGDVSGLDQGSATACWVECRSEALFVRWARAIASERDDRIWVLDGDGVLWSADALDAGRLVL
ncbi:hypothetical protein [Kribbella sp. C-35]|uniref:hypothetical protein n=1 Tax=Kribbella sp. C-35 TaxID=2789276 RepID=UPI0039794F28